MRLAYIAETKKLIPNKPIRYVMNTHPHADHTGGLPALVAEGATIITQKNNEAFLEKALNTPRTLLNDTLAKNPKKAKIEAVAEKKVYSDGTRTVEMYHVSPVPHSNGLMIAYIPKEKVLFQGDFSLPAAGAAGERSRQGPGSDSREAQSGFRSLYQRAHLRDSADQGGTVESRGEIDRFHAELTGVPGAAELDRACAIPYVLSGRRSCRTPGDRRRGNHHDQSRSPALPHELDGDADRAQGQPAAEP